MGLIRPMRLMRPMGPIGLMGLGLMGLLGLMSCSDDSEDSQDSKASMSIELMGSVTSYEEMSEGTRADEAARANVTRGWQPPIIYGNIQTELATDKSISVFFTREQETDESNEDYEEDINNLEEEYFFKSSGKWRVSKTNMQATTYYLYGYMPHDNSIIASVDRLAGKTFEDGAVLTLTNIPTVTANDLCVMIAAKNGYENGYTSSPVADYTINGLQPGDFAYVARTTGEGGTGGNYVFLLFDHLYSAISYQMRVKTEYNDLRTIKLKELSLQAFTGSTGNTSTKKRMNATITLIKTAEGADPISYISFTGNGTEEGKGSFYENTAGEALTTEYQSFQGNFMPQGVTKLKLTSRYDVYDKQGNRTRKDCEATNTIDLKELFPTQNSARRGCRYTLKFTIQPTYLYVLSEPDLDNPTVVLN